ncbi:MAG: leucine-rich repeat domain-containing protein [Kiritimatiellales bacterium]|nr:leucine-rich repeat domain-containing protein [Kiritimatiellota bacterium]MBL7012683.1 leucine-rich repeat domain-containing protein [Kiritimatiellales bacterium]
MTGTLTIPPSVASIENYAFEGCSGLTGLTIPSSVTSIGSGAFKDCSSLTGTLTIPSSVTLIDFYVFRNCSGLTGVTIPSSVTEIRGYAFYGCSGLTGLTIPSSVTTLGGYEFRKCSSLSAITVAAENPAYMSADGVLFNKNQTTLKQCPGGKTGNYTIPSSVTSIGNYAFEGCSGLIGTMTIPSSVTSIGDGAFEDCSSLTGAMTIPSGVTLIDLYVFRNCSGLTGLTIPSSVTSIRGYAFYGCSGLTEAYFQGDAPALQTGSLPDNSMTVYYLPGTTGWGSALDGHPAVLWNPQVDIGDASFGMTLGGFGFDISGTNDFTVVVEVCTNLASGVWEPLQTNSTASGSFSFNDPQATNQPSGFYRLSMP